MSDILRILVGPLLWLAAFSAVYGLEGLACAYGWSDTSVGGISLLRLVLSAAWLCAVAAQVMIVFALYSRRLSSPSDFVRRVSRTTAWVGLVATLWSLFPVVAVSPCV